MSVAQVGHGPNDSAAADLAVVHWRIFHPPEPSDPLADLHEENPQIFAAPPRRVWMQRQNPRNFTPGPEDARRALFLRKPA